MTSGTTSGSGTTGSGSTTGSTTGGGPASCDHSIQDGVIDLAPFNIPQGSCLVVSVTMTPKICAQNGGADALAKPVIYNLGGTQTCAGD